MHVRDVIVVQRWLASKTSFLEIVETGRFGLLDNERWSLDAERLFTELWTWSAPRFEGIPGWKQDRLYNRWGREFLERRYARVQRMIECYIQYGRLTPPPILSTSQQGEST